MNEQIRATTILPAKREDIELHTADGLRLVGELASPLHGEAAGTLLTLHPLPTHGGYMDSHVIRKASWRLPALAGLNVLRFNTRGTSSPRGASQGTFDGGRSEKYDVAAMLDFAAQRQLPNCWVLGWSFGTELTLKYAADSFVTGAILLSPPLHRATDADLDRWAQFGRPMKVLVPELDDYLQPDAAKARFARIPQAEVIGVDGAKHLWVGESAVRRVLDEVVATVAPAVPLPLPDHWDHDNQATQVPEHTDE